jgi:hypothetical protein
VGDARHKGKYPAFAAKSAAKAGYLGVGVLAAEGAQQCRTFADEKTDEGFPTFKSVITLVEGFAALGAMPCIDELARGFLFHRVTDCEFHAFH